MKSSLDKSHHIILLVLIYDHKCERLWMFVPSRVRKPLGQLWWNLVWMQDPGLVHRLLCISCCIGIKHTFTSTCLAKQSSLAIYSVKADDWRIASAFHFQTAINRVLAFVLHLNLRVVISCDILISFQLNFVYICDDNKLSYLRAIPKPSLHNLGDLCMLKGWFIS